MSIYFWSPDEAHGFSKWLATSRLDIKVKKKLLAQLAIFSTNGLPRTNKEKFRHVAGKICELKPTSQVRLLGFEVHPDFIIVCMGVKKKQKLAPELIAKAQQRRELYYADGQ
ncbi:type II toxin-antitoxin system RelE/ParE family toxin [Desulfohalobium retbaense]|uniref:type II toxin-antitoxin system RelE/ParE family toxin n=1 Tax=Desulfohalobium retbaense TaxID=45663 RepID=UPI00019B45F4|nr:type II toxin-antitoxin system RelE/ParE family toxin [Desulfohalobium retbaense]